MSLAWLTYPLTLTGMRMFECGDFTEEDCTYYKQHWHFWYIADYVFALPTVAFFMTAIGIFMISHFVSSILLGHRKIKGPKIWQRLIASTRYLSYRGFHVRQLRWNSAPVGVLLLGAAGTLFFFCMDLAPKPYYWADMMFGGSPPLATRSGWMALACMPFLFATATKTNWITFLTGVSHEKLQVFHRWTAYAFFILALLHTFPFIVYHVHWHDMETHFSSSLLFYWTGIVALIFQTWLTFMSHSTIRGLGYEFFKVAHFTAVAVFMITFFWHCDYTLTSWHYFIATAAIYVPCFVYPLLRTGFEYGWTQQAQISVEDNGFTCITIPAKFRWQPGQHCFLRFTGFGIMSAISAHPFTICSTPSKTSEHSELVFYIRHQKGLTAKLHQYGLDHPGVSVPVSVDGPYGGINAKELRDADHVLVIAGGSGAGWCLPFIERFVHSVTTAHSTDEEHGSDSIADKTATTTVQRRNPTPTSLSVILATRDTNSRLWFEHTVASLLAKLPIPNLSSLVRVQVFLTGEVAPRKGSKTLSQTVSQEATTPNTEPDVISPEKGMTQTSTSSQELEGRPQLPVLVKEEAARAAADGGSLAVYVCGPTTMQNDVRNAIASENLDILRGKRTGSVYLHAEHFDWA
ncbi:putative ferric-chelate reductase [Amniculicola lignicola CBS 123094]|uniref:ferric-chelate reductase (NADPH) n=1 Tax=Amniculicola lignicola CBS 123094 TaxID=1392246 RepID=A0A6A5WT80_9PLEO|nr:putative ferric-chelate reductase [Amniculicola lignicola CBS 123094]